MNYSMIRYILCKVLLFEAIFLLMSCVVAMLYGENEGIWYFAVAAAAGAIGLAGRKKPKNSVFFAKEGLVCVALSWIVMGAVGAIPFTLTGEIPSFVDALFETISGFTTTGASILTDIEVMSRCSLFWRSFTHWIGGMGVLVFILAVVPLSGGHNIHIMRAESPGPSVGKLVPKMRQTAMILYGIYLGMTVIEIAALLIAGMPFFDSLVMSFGTAGTGGFAILNSSAAEYSVACRNIITVFMMLFGVNFSVYYLVLMKRWKQAFKCEELRWYFAVFAIAVIVITIDITGLYGTFGEALRHSAFQTASIMTTTGFSSVDFNAWPALSKTILLLLMFVGACAGSTGGGLKVSRIIVYVKSVRNSIRSMLHSKRMRLIKLEGKILNDAAIMGMQAYLAAYLLIFVASVLIISADGFDLITNFTAVAATSNNIGPGLEIVGPTGNFSNFSPLSKIVLIFDMLVGRLEVFPVLVLLTPSTWRRGV